jgi:hypothetical protein
MTAWVWKKISNGSLNDSTRERSQRGFRYFLLLFDDPGTNIGHSIFLLNILVFKLSDSILQSIESNRVVNSLTA